MPSHYNREPPVSLSGHVRLCLYVPYYGAVLCYITLTINMFICLCCITYLMTLMLYHLYTITYVVIAYVI